MDKHTIRLKSNQWYYNSWVWYTSKNQVLIECEYEKYNSIK